jgi:hypothetical protein
VNGTIEGVIELAPGLMTLLSPADEKLCGKCADEELVMVA